jgi:hypothetical protein
VTGASAAEYSSAAESSRIQFVKGLRQATDTPGDDDAPRLAQTVAANMKHLWEHGGRDRATVPGRQPEWIYIHPGFLLTDSKGGEQPPLRRLIKSKGLQLRLLLLMIFDAQCRHQPGETVRNVRRVASDPARQQYAPWRQLVLAETMADPGFGPTHAELRGRQITKAMRRLEDQHLLQLPRQQPGGTRRLYDPGRDGVNWTLRSEASTKVESPPYSIPNPQNSLRISRHFWTSLWVFALTDTEIAAYLSLAWLRTRFPARHATTGVFLREDDRRDYFQLARYTWRATERLHRFRLVDRAPSPGRNFLTGNVGDRDAKWAKKQVLPYLFTLNDDALKAPALDTIHQILTDPTDEDRMRRELGQAAVDAAAALAPNPFTTPSSLFLPLPSP